MKNKNYNIIDFKNITIGNLGVYESNILKYNGFDDLEKVKENFPDLFYNYWMDNFLKDMRLLSNGNDFVNYINNNKDRKYVIIGDYDTDGIMATVIMKSALERLGIKVDHLIPNRLSDGYGMSVELVDRAIDLGAETIITVDNGISSREAVKYAKFRGLDVLITDHHIPDEGEELPKADYIFNPHLSDPDLEISGAFVALKLIFPLFDINDNNTSYYLRDMGVLAGITVVSDMMPVVGENRVLLKSSLNQFNFYKSKNIWAGLTLKILRGLGAPYRVTAKENEEIVTEDTIGFYISPTVNAQGRVNGEVNAIVDEIIEAQQYGKYIDDKQKRQTNYTRRDRTADIMADFEEEENNPVQFYMIDIDEFDYSIGGLIGLGANSMLTETGKPSFMGYFNEEKNTYSFSGRAPEGFSLYDIFIELKEEYPDSEITGGGHASALGMNIPADPEFYTEVQEFFNTRLKKLTVSPTDVFHIVGDQLVDIAEAQDRLAPYGNMFERPKYVMNVDLEFYKDEEGKKRIQDKYSGLTFMFYPRGIKEGVQKIVCYIDTSNIVRYVLKIEDIIEDDLNE